MAGSRSSENKAPVFRVSVCVVALYVTEPKGEIVPPSRNSRMPSPACDVLCLNLCFYL
jgi:hypothetical protein